MTRTATRHVRVPGRGAGSNGRVKPGSAAGTPDPVASPALPTDPVGAAKAAGLRYVTDQGPASAVNAPARAGATSATTAAVRDRAVLKRIKALVIPPAWTGVWICPDPRGHLQATGRDARGSQAVPLPPALARRSATRRSTAG